MVLTTKPENHEKTRKKKQKHTNTIKWVLVHNTQNTFTD